MSKGNAEQPTAQAPRGHSSPNRVEVSGDGQQGAPQSPGTPRPQSPGTPGPRDQSADAATARRTGRQQALPTVRPPRRPQVQEPTSPNGQEPQPAIPRNCHRPQPTAGGRPGGAPSPPPTQQKHRAGAADPAETRAGVTNPAEDRGRRRGRRRQLSRSRCPLRRLSHDRNRRPGRPGRERFTPAQLRTPSPPTTRDSHINPGPGALPVWDPPPPPAPKQSVLGRLGFGRKAEPPEAYPTAPPGQQQPATPITQPAPTSPGGATPSSAQTGPVHRQDRRLVRRSSSARRLETRLVPQPVRGRSGRWSDRGSHHPGRSPRSLRRRRPVSRAPPGTGPARRNHRSNPRRTGWCPAGRASCWAASPDAPGLVNPAARMPGAPAYPAAPVAVPVPAPGQQPSDWPTGRNQPVPAGSEGAGRRPITLPSPRWAWPGEPARRDCGCRGSTRGR